jgi:hypothetical protein
MRVKVFSDESGTPSTVRGQVFLVAAYAVASPTELVSVTNRSSSQDRQGWVFSELRRLEAQPSVVLLSPRDNTADLWNPKFKVISGAAQARRTVLGNQYVSRRGLNENDFLWSYCTEMAVARAVVNVVREVMPTEIGGIDVLLDRKTMTAEHRELAERMPRLIPGRLAEIIEGLAGEAPGASQPWVEWMKKVDLRALPVTVDWYATSPDGGPHAMSLANALSQEMGAEHRVIGSGRPLTGLLLAAGYSGFVYDATHDIEAPVDAAVLVRWGEELGVLVGQNISR